MAASSSASPTVVELDMLEPLPPQLQVASPKTTHLTLAQDTPSDPAWTLLAAHFSSVTHLHIDSGYDENLTDAGIPLQWPLQKLTLSSACGEVCRSRWVIGEGRGSGGVAHLVLNYVAGLRFEGPTTEELLAMEEEDKKEEVCGIKVTYVPDLATEWMRKKYQGRELEDEGNEEVGESALRTLEIIENDVHDMLFRLMLALPLRLARLETLSVVAPSVHDFELPSEDVLEKALPQLERLERLVLVLEDVYRDRTRLLRAWRWFPKGLKVLRFRSSIALAKDTSVVEEWVARFKDPDWLPELRTLSLVCDMKIGEGRRSETTNESTAASLSAEKPPGVSDEDLALAKRACERIYQAAEARGIIVEPFKGAWTAEFTSLDKFIEDERWERV